MRPVGDGNNAIAVHSATATRFAAGYEGLDRDPYRNCFLYSRHRLATALEPHLAALPAGTRVLDAGCGPGRQLSWLRDRGFEPTGVDGSADMIALARAGAPWAPVMECDLRQRLPFSDHTFDLVLSIEVLRYIPERHGMLEEFARVLRPGGMVLATALPLWNANGFGIINALGRRYRKLPVSHLRQFLVTAGGIESEFRAAGFPHVRAEGVYTGPVNWIERLAPKLLPRALRGWEPLDAKFANTGPLRQFANMFLICAVRE